jgi:hypothetical protein
MKTLYFQGKLTTLQLNDVIRVEQVKGIAEIVFMRPVQKSEDEEPKLVRMYLHRVGERYVDTLCWCSKENRTPVINLICTVLGFDLKELEHQSIGDLPEEGSLRFYQLIPRQQ